MLQSRFAFAKDQIVFEPARVDNKVMTSKVISFEDKKYESLLKYWFGEIRYERSYFEERMGIWFGKSDSVDADLRIRFGDWFDELERTGLPEWRKTDRGLLALVILTDQVSRNIFRDSERAFRYDSLAETVVSDLIAGGRDLSYSLPEKMFLYLPLEHSENEFHQIKSVEKFGELLKESPPSLRPYFEDALEYARRHREIIGRFGRFPHRNRALSRETTPQEREFLRQPGSSF